MQNTLSDLTAPSLPSLDSAPVLNYAYPTGDYGAEPYLPDASASGYFGMSRDEFIRALREAMSGMGVYMSDQRVGYIVQRVIRNNVRANGGGYTLV